MIAACAVSAICVFLATPGADAADRPLTGYGNLHFGMSRDQVLEAINGKGSIDSNGRRIRATEELIIEQRRLRTSYLFDVNNTLEKVLIENSAKAEFLECLSTFQFYLQLLTNKYGNASHIIQDATAAARTWRAMYMFSSGGAIHLNTDLKGADDCGVEIFYLAPPTEERSAQF